MAMRPRSGGFATAPRRGGASSGAVRSVYEDFKPVAEWQQDDGTHILNIHLPVFMKEQIKVSTEGRNTIRVRGERLVAGNKWNRFSEDYQVPDNGEMNSVRAKYQGGILTITVPKGKVSALPPKAEGIDDIRKQSTPQKGQEKEVSTSRAMDSTTQGTYEKGVEPNKAVDTGKKQGQEGDQKQLSPQKGQEKEVSSSRAMDSTTQGTYEKGVEPNKVVDTGKKQGQEVDQKQLSPQKGRDEAFPTVDATSQSTEGKSLEPEKTLGDLKEERNQDSNQRRSFTPLKKNTASHDGVRDESGEHKDKHVASERPDDVKEKTVGKEGKGIIGLPDVETNKTMKLEKDGANKELYGALKMEKYKKTVKGLTELNEERQSLVNVGVAVLVIMALTAYITYGFASAKDQN